MTECAKSGRPKHGGEPAHLPEYRPKPSQACNSYDLKYTILNVENPGLQAGCLPAVCAARDVLVRTLDLLGIPVPERM